MTSATTTKSRWISTTTTTTNTTATSANLKHRTILLKYLMKFWRSLDLPLMNCEVELHLDMDMDQRLPLDRPSQ